MIISFGAGYQISNSNQERRVKGMPVRDCMTSSPFCPANQESKFAVPGYEATGCDSCVEESLKNDEIPKCFFCKLEEEGPLDGNDF